MQTIKRAMAWVLVVSVIGFAQASGPPDFLFDWGIVGFDGGQFLFPVGLTVDGADRVYVTDVSQHRVQVFDAEGRFLRQWGEQGGAPGQFRQPQDVAADSNNHVYVTDGNNGRVQKFTPQGDFLTAWGRLGHGPGEFSLMRGLGTDAQDRVYVADFNNGRVQRFDPAGELLGILGEGTLADPVDVAVDDDGNLYVTEYNRGTVVKLDPRGKPLAEWGRRFDSRPENLQNPQNIAIRDQRVYVSDAGHHRVVAFTLAGAYVTEWGSRCHLSFLDGCVDPDGAGPLEQGDGQFLQPRGLGLNSRGEVYVVDMFNHRVEVFEPVRP